MLFKSTVAIISLMASSAMAVGNARVINNCDRSVFLYSTGDQAQGPFELAAYGGTYAEQFGTTSSGSGKALAMSLTSDGIYNNQPTLTYAYALTNGQIWYNLDQTNGQPFINTLTQVPSDTSCPSNVWPGGVPPQGSGVKVCQQATDVVLTLCNP